MIRRSTTTTAMTIFLLGLWFGDVEAARLAEAQQDKAESTVAKTPDCVFVPTPHDVVEKMLEMAKIKKNDVVYDLGCGDGRIVVQAAKKRGCKGVGFEIVDKLIKEARANAKKNGVSHLVEIKNVDLFTVDMSQATVLPMYLLPQMLVKLKPQFEKLKPGTRIVSHDYHIEGIEPDKVVTIVSKETSVDHVIYLYTAPLKKSK